MYQVTPARRRLLVAVRELEDDCESGAGVPAIEIEIALGVNKQRASRLIRDLVNPAWDYGNPWLERAQFGGVLLTERGGLALEATRARKQTKAQAWIDRARWPSTLQESMLVNVAIPTCTRRYVEHPEQAAFRHADHLLPRVDEYSESEYKRAWRRIFD